MPGSRLARQKISQKVYAQPNEGYGDDPAQQDQNPSHQHRDVVEVRRNLTNENVPKIPYRKASYKKKCREESRAYSHDSPSPVASRVVEVVRYGQSPHKVVETRRRAPHVEYQAKGKKPSVVLGQIEHICQQQAARVCREISNHPIGKGTPLGRRNPADERRHYQEEREQRQHEVKGNSRGQIRAVIGVEALPNLAHQQNQEMPYSEAAVHKTYQPIATHPFARSADQCLGKILKGFP
jgi:hypothetical protein